MKSFAIPRINSGATKSAIPTGLPRPAARCLRRNPVGMTDFVAPE
jgi:hypothetical protein